MRFRFPWQLLFGLLALLSLTVIGGHPADAQDEGFTPEDLSKTIVFIPLEGEITKRRCNSVWKKAERLVERNCKKIVFQIDTDGGDYKAAYELARDIYELQNRGVDTFAYLSNGKRAISAGALIAFSCRELVLGSNTRIGDVAPVDMFGTPLPEKIKTVVRADLVRYAKSHAGWPIPIVEGMVSQEMEIFEIIERRSGGDRKSYMSGSELSTDPDADRYEKRLIFDKNKIVTLDEQLALEYGFVNEIYATRNQFLEGYGIADYPATFDEAMGNNVEFGKTRVVDYFANNPFPKWVKFLLILFGIVGLAFEMKMPGTLIGGSFFLVCFTAFFIEGFSTQFVGWTELILFPAAVLLLAAELFVIPGFGVAGILGVSFLFTSLSLALIAEGEPLKWSTFSSQLSTIILALASAGILILLILRFLPGGRSKGASGFISTTTLGDDSRIAETGHTLADDTALIGKKGEVHHDLRPAGKILLDGEQSLRDVVALGSFIAKGTRVKITRIEGNRVVVEPLESEA